MPKAKHGGKREGAGRKPISERESTILIAVAMPTGLVEKLDAVAEEEGLNRSQAVREAVTRFVGKR